MVYTIQVVFVYIIVLYLTYLWYILFCRDRCRSITNLFSHALCVVVTYELSKSALSEDNQEVTENILNTEITV